MGQTISKNTKNPQDTKNPRPSSSMHRPKKNIRIENIGVLSEYALCQKIQIYICPDGQGKMIVNL